MKPVTLLQHDFEQIFVEVAEATKAAIATATAPLQKRIEEFEHKLAEVETHGVRYMGVFQRALVYEKGSLVTHDGSMWCAVERTSDEPGSGSNAWQLAVKRGRDAKERTPALK